MTNKSNSTRSTLSTVDKVERVESDFVASVDARSSLSTVLSHERLTKCRPSATAFDKTRKHYLWSEGDYESMAAYLHQVRWTDLLTTNFTANDL